LAFWKKLVFSAVVSCVLFACVELLLGLIGVRPLLVEEDPFIGFSSTVPLFVEQDDGSGPPRMVTAENRLRLFNRQSFPKSKSRRACRIFCLGGSTTYGRPYDDTSSFAGWLREFLPAADPSRDWQVINAGGISYASYRVTMLMEELARYEPDVFIVYTGHNEFLEHRTYGPIRSTPAVLQHLEVALNRCRTYSALTRLIRPLRRSSPEATETRDLLPAEVDAILDRTIGPESYTRDDDLRGSVLEHFRVSLERMTVLAREAGAELIFVTPASNIRDFTPFKSEHLAGLSDADQSTWLGHMERAGTAFRAQQFAPCLEALDRAAEIDDRYAKLQFLRGRVLLRLERSDEARTALLRARDEDICPLRAITPIEQTVRDVAARHSVPMIDFVAMMEQDSQDGIPGFDVFLDHVHPKIEGHRGLALELIATLQQRGIVARTSSWDEAAIEEVTGRVLGGLDYRAHANALRNLAKVLGWAGKFQEADDRARLAVLGLPNDANAHYLAGNAFWRDGSLDEAIKEFELAVEINPDYNDALVQLGYILLEDNQPKAALKSFQRALQVDSEQADVYFEIGEIYLADELLDKAASMYRETLRIAANSVGAYKRLGQIASWQDRSDAAVRYYEQGLDIDPADSELHAQLAAVFEARRDYSAATDHYQLSLLLNPRDAACYLGLGRVAEAQQDRELAGSYYRQALNLEPQSAEAQQGIDRCGKANPAAAATER
jgi:tetratricopeptide (TPR) repeat protein